jgi:cold shock protein
MEKIKIEYQPTSIKGKVKWFNDAKGYGLATSDEIIGDIFLHYSAIKRRQPNEFQTLNECEEITFEVVSGPKGPQAFNINRSFT